MYRDDSIVVLVSPKITVDTGTTCLGPICSSHRFLDFQGPFPCARVPLQLRWPVTADLLFITFSLFSSIVCCNIERTKQHVMLATQLTTCRRLVADTTCVVKQNDTKTK